MKNMSTADSDRGRLLSSLRVRDDSKFLNLLENGDEKSKNEILKLKELPNERLEGSWGALWLGIRTFFGFKLESRYAYFTYLTLPYLHAYLTYLTYILTLLTYLPYLLDWNDEQYPK